MKVLLAGLLLVSSVIYGQTGNAPRYRNNPTQFAFGVRSQVAPWNVASKDDTLFQPPALITNTESFGSVSDFTVVGSGQTFTVSGGVGTISSTGASSVLYVDTATENGNPQNQAPDDALRITLNQIGAAPTSNLMEVGYCTPTNSVRVMAVYDQVNGEAEIESFSGGVSTLLGATAWSPAAGTAFALQVNGSGDGIGGETDYANALFMARSASGVWSAVTTVGLGSNYDLAQASNLGNLAACFYVETGGATTTSWQVSNFINGSPGYYVGNLAPIIYTDGRPVVLGTKIYLQLGGSYGYYDVSTGEGAETSHFWFNQSGVIISASTTAKLLYDPVNADFRLIYDFWNNSSPTSTLTYAATIPQSTADWLSPGVHVVNWSAFTQLSHLTINTGWDHSLVCSQWNQSSATCSKWCMAYLGAASSTNLQGEFDCTAGDPSSNPTWTNVMQSNALGLQEGWNITRSRSNNYPSGISYWPTSTQTPFPNGATYTLWNGLYQGYTGYGPMGTDFLSSTPHQVLVESGNKAYLFGYVSTGNNSNYLTVATAPINIAAPSMHSVNYVSDSGGTATPSITSPSSSLQGGCYVVFSHANAASLTGISISSSPAGSWSTVVFTNGGSGNNYVTEAIATLASGATTFTSTPSASATHQDMVVMQINSSKCVADGAATTGTAWSNNDLSVPSITTTQSGLSLLCGYTSTATGYKSGSSNGAPLPFYAYDSANLTPTQNAHILCSAGAALGPQTNGEASQTFTSTSAGVGIFSSIEFTNFAPTAQQPTFSLAEGTYFGTQSVSLGSSTPSTSSICYTLDGTIPSGDFFGNCTHGTLYTSPISISTTETVNAVSVKAGFQPSVIATSLYSILAAPTRLYAHKQQSPTPSSLSYTIMSPVVGSAYIVIASQFTDGPSSCSTSPAQTQTNFGSFTFWGAAGIVFQANTASNITVTCNYNTSGADASIEVISCLPCTGTIESIGTANATNTGESVTVNPTNRNVNLVDVYSTGGVHTATINGTPVTALGGAASVATYDGYLGFSTGGSQVATITTASGSNTMFSIPIDY